MPPAIGPGSRAGRHATSNKNANATNDNTYSPRRFDQYRNSQNDHNSNSIPNNQYNYENSTQNQDPASFGAYNLPLWNQMDMDSINQFNDATSSMAFMNPQFFMNNPMPPFPMMPFNSMLPFQGAQQMSTMAGSAQQSRRQRSSTPAVTVPTPTQAYMQQASGIPQRCQKRPLLVILDLNGTLICRKHRRLPPSFAERAGLKHFLDELFKNYSVMVWTSSRPPTLNAIVKILFPSKSQKRKLVALWGRDKFGLTTRQYNAKLQVYKELHKVWDASECQFRYPGNGGPSKDIPMPPFPKGRRWDQTNTILIDDSKIKALSEPYNILEVPEFTNDPNIDESTFFQRVLARLDVLAHHDDVSKVFRVWEERQVQQNCKILDLDITPEMDDDVDLSEDGGAKLPPVLPTPATAKQRKAAAAQQKQPPTEPAIEAEKKALKKARKQAKKQERKEKRVLAAAELAEEAAAAAAAAPGAIDNDPQSLPSQAPDQTAKLGRKARKRLRQQAMLQQGLGPTVSSHDADPSEKLSESGLENVAKEDGAEDAYSPPASISQDRSVDGAEDTYSPPGSISQDNQRQRSVDGAEDAYSPPGSISQDNSRQRSVDCVEEPYSPPGSISQDNSRQQSVGGAEEPYSPPGSISQDNSRQQSVDGAEDAYSPSGSISQDNARHRSVSPARSGVSTNSLLDRLEEGLGIKGN
ncbi:hypothetical protein N7466_009262 [Penicillium verhagenii]|uniref:uncharacterized protein n=1 Tax=Penicillium verhagenii TaxID=1562060 RepID=UPI0025458828|nr:uncharacterized protein N7466_009262 [Penicillium verhagenii]KAJ5920936.1 hypothetical protein N7466_009262 [Penicillium verhagenii]